MVHPTHKTPSEILEAAFQQASSSLGSPLIDSSDTVDRVEFVCRNLQNRAGTRLLLACLLAKICNPSVDIRKPYTEIGGDDSYSGRTYDEAYVTAFVTQHQLPCNSTTAFLTPAFRNRNITLERVQIFLLYFLEFFHFLLLLCMYAHFMVFQHVFGIPTV